MAHTRYEYVKGFELADNLLPRCWVVVRVDGRGFTKFCEKHAFQKPNDERALALMNSAATARLYPACRTSCSRHSDEYSFVFRKDTTLKLASVVVSLFAAAYVMRWPEHLIGVPLLQPPAFDARAVQYPDDATLRDYLAWRQADCHINCQYNACFWALVGAGASREEAQARLRGTQTAEKNEILFSQFGVNYADLPALHRKGTVVFRRRQVEEVKAAPAGGGAPVLRERSRLVVEHVDLIGPAFWAQHSHLMPQAAAPAPTNAAGGAADAALSAGRDAARE